MQYRIVQQVIVQQLFVTTANSVDGARENYDRGDVELVSTDVIEDFGEPFIRQVAGA